MTRVLECATCQHNRDRGWWGLQRGTHCRECHRTWTAGAHCYACHLHFSSGTGFDLHQREGCHDLAEQIYACGAPRFVVLGPPGQETITGTLHAAICRDWGRCGMPAR